MLDSVISKTRKCRFKFECLGKNSRYPVCTTVGANGENVLFLDQTDTDINCHYRGTSNKRFICSCPVHYEIHNKQQSMKSDSVLRKKMHAEKCQYAIEGESVPKTLEEAVQFLVNELPQKYKIAIADMGADEIGDSAMSLIKYIQYSFDLASGNKELMQSCSEYAGKEIDHPEDASVIILSRFVMDLAKTYT